jgi:16S rRNA processing protein RimM
LWKTAIGIKQAEGFIRSTLTAPGHHSARNGEELAPGELVAVRAAGTMLLMEPHSEWVVLARILRPQGRKGEVLADLFTDFPERFTQRPQVWLAPQGYADAHGPLPGGVTRAEVAAHWLPTGKNAGRIVLHFSGVDSIEQAGKLAGKEVLVPLTERLPLDADQTYVSDLMGCTVYDRDQPLGVIEDVQFPTSPDGSRRLEDAAPLLAVLSPDGSEILIPFARAYLVELDVAAKIVRMTLPEGLAELNRQVHRATEEIERQTETSD